MYNEKICNMHSSLIKLLMLLIHEDKMTTHLARTGETRHVFVRLHI